MQKVHKGPNGQGKVKEFICLLKKHVRLCTNAHVLLNIYIKPPSS